mgnify:CR=1 FL=1
MPVPTVEEIKEYLKIDTDEEDDQIQDFINAAVEELADSGVKDQSTSSYGLAVKLLVANYYSERRPQAIGTIVTKLNYSLDRIILRLKARELPAGEEDEID